MYVGFATFPSTYTPHDNHMLIDIVNIVPLIVSIIEVLVYIRQSTTGKFEITDFQ